MSIISKALKKAQQERLKEIKKKKEQAVPPQRQVSAEFSLQDRLRQSRIPILRLVSASALVILISCGGIATAVLLYVNSRPPATIPPVSSSLEKTPSLPETRKDIATESRPEPQAETHEDKNACDKPINDLLETKDADSPAAAGNIPLPVLNGIMYSPSLPQAIINGTVVSEGETINGFSIVEILPDRVKISSDGKKFELKLR